MYLGIDLGTSGVKAVLMNDEHEVLAQAQAALTVSQPFPLWSEQDPAAWWQATEQAIGQLKIKSLALLKQVKAIGLSGQQHGATLLNRQGQILRPAILWNDGRSHQECHILEQRVPRYAEITGNRIMPGFTAPKLLWVKQHEPDIFAQIHQVLLPKDYLRWQMSGDYASDLADAAGTSWVNVAERRYSPEMIAATDLAQEQLPKLYEGTEITSTVRAAIADAWGIPKNTVIVAGAGDNAAGAMSFGIIEAGSAFLSLGTSGVYFVANHQYQSNPFQGVHSMCHCLPQVWNQMTVHLSAASCLTWLAKQLNISLADMMNIAAQEPRSHDRVIFLPYLTGERSPHNDAFARGLFFGMSQGTTRSDLIHAVLEGIGFAFLDGQNALVDAKVNINEINVVGGGAQSPYWGQILANILQKPLTYRAHREVGSALGAARLAWLGYHAVDAKKAFAPSAIEKVIAPQSTPQDELIAKYEIYRALYQRNKDLFPKLVITK